MEILAFNREAWNKQVVKGCEWTVPVGPEVIAAARRGDWEIYLTNSRPVPREWFPDLAGLDVLCLASGGGQQGPILAAAGAHITVFDLSPRQLEQDRAVAEREGLDVTTIEGDMADLHVFPDESHDLIVHPVSNCFVPHVRPVWAEAYRVLRCGGSLLAGFVNPIGYSFDRELEQKGVYQVKYALPYSDLTSITPEEKAQYDGPDAALEFSHTLEDQIGGQLDAGFVIVGFYEDYQPDEPIGRYLPSLIATRALKPLSP
jgi:SAM-dependent methyltransferase